MSARAGRRADPDFKERRAGKHEMRGGKRMKRLGTTIRGRLIIISLLGIFSGIIGCVMVSKVTIDGIGEQRLERTMRTKLTEEVNHLEICYLTMVRLMMQLGSEGTTGQIARDYVSADNNFDKYVKKKELQDELVAVAFTNLYVSSLTYIDSETQLELLENLPIEVEKPYSSNIDVFQIGENIFQAMHRSSTMYGDNIVVSLLSKNQRFGDRDLDIYIEMKSNITEYEMDARGDTESFIFVQLSEDNRVCYCNGPMFEAGETLDISLEEDGSYSGKFRDYFVIAQKSIMGFTYLIAVPRQTYQYEYTVWYRRIAVLCLISIIPAFLIMLGTWKIIGKPIQLLEKEIVAVGNGDLEQVNEDMMLDEFRALMHEVNEMKVRIQELLGAVKKEEKQKQKIEREKLMYQINPHFVLNTLNSIEWMAVMEHQINIGQFVADLKVLLAYNLDKEGKPSTLRTEIEMAGKYISLQKQRYDFEALIEVEEGEYLETKTIRMLLQPLIENALRYGLGETGRIDIQVFYDSVRQYAVITVLDYGKGLDQQKLQKLNEPFRYQGDAREENSGIGLRYVRSCLEGFYGGNAILTINSTLGKGTKITIMIPVCTRGKAE